MPLIIALRRQRQGENLEFEGLVLNFRASLIYIVRLYLKTKPYINFRFTYLIYMSSFAFVCVSTMFSWCPQIIFQKSASKSLNCSYGVL